MDKELKQELKLLTHDELEIVKEFVHTIAHTPGDFSFRKNGVKVTVEEDDDDYV